MRKFDIDGLRGAAVGLALLAAGCSGSAEVVRQGPPPSEPAAAVTPVAAEPSPSPFPAGITRRLRESERANAPVSGPPPALQFRPGAEDSDVATGMNEKGEVMEARVFKRHAQLARAEAVWKSPNLAELKIMLKGGKSVTVTTDKLTSLTAATTRELLALAGESPRSARTGSKPVKQ